MFFFSIVLQIIYQVTWQFSVFWKYRHFRDLCVWCLRSNTNLFRMLQFVKQPLGVSFLMHTVEIAIFYFLPMLQGEGSSRDLTDQFSLKSQVEPSSPGWDTAGICGSVVQKQHSPLPNTLGSADATPVPGILHWRTLNSLRLLRQTQEPDAARA